MGHKKSGTFAYYVQVRDDTQSAFMETPARDALLKLSTNASLTRDASAPQDLTVEEKRELEKDPELMDLKLECKALRDDLIVKHHQIGKGKGTELYNNFQKLQNKIRAKRKKLHDSAKQNLYNEFFYNVGNHIIEQNYQGKPVKFEPDLTHVLPERKALADLEFKNRDVDTVDDAELVEDRIRSLELRLALHKLNIPKALNKRIWVNEPAAVTFHEADIPMESNSGLECPVCLGRSHLHSGARRYKYARKDTLQRHFATHKLKETFPEGRICDTPGCDLVLKSLSQYKHHQARMHKTFL
jgi:hypothetical protein